MQNPERLDDKLRAIYCAETPTDRARRAIWIAKSARGRQLADAIDAALDALEAAVGVPTSKNGLFKAAGNGLCAWAESMRADIERIQANDRFWAAQRLQ